MQRCRRQPELRLSCCNSGPMVYIAGYWTSRAFPTKVVVYSNREEVELWLNGKRLRQQKPEHGPDSEYGAYYMEADPMYWTKNQDTFAATSEGRQSIQGKGTAMFDGGNWQHLEADVVNARGEVAPDSGDSVRFKVSGGAWLVTPAQSVAEAGVASAILQSGTVPGNRGLSLPKASAAAVLPDQGSLCRSYGPYEDVRWVNC